MGALRFVAAAGALALAACAKAPEPAAPEAPLELVCAAFADASAQSLAARFGAANMREETLPGAEGDEYQATVIFPEDRERRIEIVWADPAARTGVSQVSISGEQSGWRGPAGLALGMSADEVAFANGAPFTIAGFGWDLGGWVGDWKGGVLSHASCHVGMRLSPRGDYSSAVGDKPFSSDSAEVRLADPRVLAISLRYVRE